MTVDAPGGKSSLADRADVAEKRITAQASANRRNIEPIMNAPPVPERCASSLPATARV